MFHFFLDKETFQEEAMSSNTLTAEYNCLDLSYLGITLNISL